MARMTAHAKDGKNSNATHAERSTSRIANTVRATVRACAWIGKGCFEGGSVLWSALLAFGPRRHAPVRHAVLHRSDARKTGRVAATVTYSAASARWLIAVLSNCAERLIGLLLFVESLPEKPLCIIHAHFFGPMRRAFRSVKFHNAQPLARRQGDRHRGLAIPCSPWRLRRLPW